MLVDHGPRHAADDGQANGAADLLAGVEHAGSHSLVLVGYPGDQGHRERDEDQPGGRSEDDQRQGDAGQGLAVLADAGRPAKSGLVWRPAGGVGTPRAQTTDLRGETPGT